jgi:hypothetical protein
MANVVYCSLRGCWKCCERAADGTPGPHGWLTWRQGCQRRYFCSANCYRAWLANRRPSTGHATPPTRAKQPPQMGYSETLVTGGRERW